MDIDGMQSQEEGVGESELARKKRMGKKYGGEGDGFLCQMWQRRDRVEGGGGGDIGPNILSHT